MDCSHYFGARRLRLQITESHDPFIKSSNFVTVEIRKLALPVTYSPAMQIILDGRLMFLKLYDRRFCPQMRKNEVTPAWNNEREKIYSEFISSESGVAFATSLEQNKGCLDPTSIAQEEAYIHNECNNHYQTEISVYRKLEQLQAQRLIPKLFATVSFTTRNTIQAMEKYFTVRGILLEYIEGYNLADLKSTDVPLEHWPVIADAAIRAVVEVSKRGILNCDVKLQNFIVRKDLSVVQVDYSLCISKNNYESEEDWREAKERQDEVGAVAVKMRRKIRENGGEA